VGFTLSPWWVWGMHAARAGKSSVCTLRVSERPGRMHAERAGDGRGSPPGPRDPYRAEHANYSSLSTPTRSRFSSAHPLLEEPSEGQHPSPDDIRHFPGSSIAPRRREVNTVNTGIRGSGNRRAAGGPRAIVGQLCDARGGRTGGSGDGRVSVRAFRRGRGVRCLADERSRSPFDDRKERCHHGGCDDA
jgi:hypothetical protein